MPSTASGSKPGSGPSGKNNKNKGSGKSSAYDKNFEQNLAEYNVLGPRRTHKPGNLKEWRDALQKRRASLSPSRFTDEDHDAFLDAIDDAKNEAEVMSGVFPTLKGTTRYPWAMNRPYFN